MGCHSVASRLVDLAPSCVLVASYPGGCPSPLVKIWEDYAPCPPILSGQTKLRVALMMAKCVQRPCDTSCWGTTVLFSCTACGFFEGIWLAPLGLRMLYGSNLEMFFKPSIQSICINFAPPTPGMAPKGKERGCLLTHCGADLGCTLTSN